MSETNTNPEARDVIAKAAGMAFSDFSGLNTDEECADAIIAALAAEGMVIVPRVPTKAMIDAVEDYAGCQAHNRFKAWWRAALAALPTPTLPPAGDDT